MVTDSIDPFERMPFLRYTENSHSVCAVHEGLPPAEDLIQLTSGHIPEVERGLKKKKHKTYLTYLKQNILKMSGFLNII